MKELSILEALLFAAGESVDAAVLAGAIDADIESLHEHMRTLTEKYKTEKRGIAIIKLEDAYQMCTNPEYFSYVQKVFAAPAKKTLTQPLMETLAIIAYKQPVTKAQIEEIRGVTADHAVNKLLDYGLVVEKGRLQTPGKPLIFGTSEEFLRFFGFSDLTELPEKNNQA